MGCPRPAQRRCARLMVRIDAHHRAWADWLRFQINGDETSARVSENRLAGDSGHLGQLINREMFSGEGLECRNLVDDADLLIRVTPHTSCVFCNWITKDIDSTKLENLQAQFLDREKRQAFIVDAAQRMVINDVDREPGPVPDNDRQIE